MTASFPVPSVVELHNRLLADFEARFPEIGRPAKGTGAWQLLMTFALGAAGLHAHADAIYEDLFPDTAEGAALDHWGVVYNVTRKPATPARKDDALRLVGTAAAAYVSGAELLATDGTRYELTESGSIPLAGWVDVSVAALDTGTGTRKPAGEVLTFVSAPAGIEGSAELQLDVDEDGDDVESDQDFRARILDRIARPGMGGNANDYRTWAEEVTGIADGYVFPLRQGLGSVDLAALHTGRGSVRLLTSDERDELQAYIDERRPVSVADFRVLEVVELPTRIKLGIQVSDDILAGAWDWDDETPPEVTGWDPATRTLTLDAMPADLEEGDRIVIVSDAAVADADVNEGEEITVEEISGLDLVLAAVPTGTPTAGDVVRSGGGKVEAVREEIRAWVDTLGPARGAHASGWWQDKLTTSKLKSIGEAEKGVIDTDLDAPVADVVPDNTAPEESIELVTAIQVAVYRMW